MASPATLPPLAWLLSLEPPRPMLVCGRDVEIFADGFFEGCWAGAFDELGFAEAQHVFGSGGKIQGDRWRLVTPSHTLDAVYVLERAGRFLASNSLVFLVRWADLTLPFDPSLGARLVSVRRGIAEYQRVLARGADWTLYRACWENVEISGEGLRFLPKALLRNGFDGFESYRDFLLDVLRRVVDNGAARGRRVPYALMTTCSSGYDSTACAALAASLGARQALTLRTARGARSDSGRRTAQRLGLEAVEVERPTPGGRGFEEAEFLATGMGGDDYIFSGFHPHCRHKILLTGFYADGIWNRGAKPSPTLARKDLAGASLAEFRLRSAFVNLPVAAIGFAQAAALARIANDAAMRPWQTGGGYDRPIPRRIAEEAGVPRGEFATSKRGGSIAFNYASFWWSAEALADLRRFERDMLREAGGAARYRAAWWMRTSALVGFYGLKKLARRAGLDAILERARDALFPDYWTFHYTHPRYGRMAFLWALDKLKARYPRAGTAMPPANDRWGADEPRKEASAS